MTIQDQRDVFAKAHLKKVEQIRVATKRVVAQFEAAESDTERYLVLLQYATEAVYDSSASMFDKDLRIRFPLDEVSYQLILSYEELKNEGFVRCQREEFIFQNEKGFKVKEGLFLDGITYKGRLELARLQKEKRDNSLWRRPFVFFIYGSLVTVMISATLSRVFDTILDKVFGEKIVKVVCLDDGLKDKE